MDASLDGLELCELLDFCGLALDDVDVGEFHRTIQIKGLALEVMSDLNSNEVLLFVPRYDGHLLTKEVLGDRVLKLHIAGWRHRWR